MQLAFAPARDEDLAAIAAIRTAASEQLTAAFGPGAWSWPVSLESARRAMRSPIVLLAWAADVPVATWRLQSRKPWSIDTAHFTPVRKPLYLVDMAVDPELQRQGVGRQCLAEAERRARAWPADAIRLDAYDAPAGAGPFYQRCGFREVGRSDRRGTPLRYFERLLAHR
jgi:GNAT superfamily N-acetyltransferase